MAATRRSYPFPIIASASNYPIAISMVSNVEMKKFAMMFPQCVTKSISENPGSVYSHTPTRNGISLFTRTPGRVVDIPLTACFCCIFFTVRPSVLTLIMPTFASLTRSTHMCPNAIPFSMNVRKSGYMRRAPIPPRTSSICLIIADT